MGPPYIKDESPPGPEPLLPTLSPTPKAEPSVANEDPPEETRRSPFSNSVWKRDDVSNRAKMVQIKERAVKNGITGLFRFMATMKRHVNASPSAQGRMDKIRESRSLSEAFSLLY